MPLQRIDGHDPGFCYLFQRLSLLRRSELPAACASVLLLRLRRPRRLLRAPAACRFCSRLRFSRCLSFRRSWLSAVSCVCAAAPDAACPSFSALFAVHEHRHTASITAASINEKLRLFFLMVCFPLILMSETDAWVFAAPSNISTADPDIPVTLSSHRTSSAA